MHCNRGTPFARQEGMSKQNNANPGQYYDPVGEKSKK